MPRRAPVAGRLARGFLGVVLGACTALPALGVLAGLGLLLLLTVLVPPARAVVLRTGSTIVRSLTQLEIQRLKMCYSGVDGLREGGDRRSARYLVARSVVGMLGLVVVVLLVLGAVSSVQVVWAWSTGTYVSAFGPAEPWIVVYFFVLGAVLLFLALSGVAGVAVLDLALARQLLAPTAEELLERRVAELATSRAEVVDAVNAERRRIERDIHDGVQQRLVALAMLIGRARRHAEPEQAGELMRQAHEESQRVLADLQDVAWRVYPAALDDLGLRETLASIAERSAVPVTVEYELVERLPSPVEAVAYFVVSEAITNAVKHAEASLVTVRVNRTDNVLVMRVTDDGRGGADPRGGGLSGLAQRVAALDGRFEVDSPVGGPTTVTAELPCA